MGFIEYLLFSCLDSEALESIKIEKKIILKYISNIINSIITGVIIYKIFSPIFRFSNIDKEGIFAFNTLFCILCILEGFSLFSEGNEKYWCLVPLITQCLCCYSDYFTIIAIIWTIENILFYIYEEETTIFILFFY